MGTAVFVLVVFMIGAGFCVTMHAIRERGAGHQNQLLENAFKKQLEKHPHLSTARLVRQKDEISGESAVGILTDRIYQCDDGSYWLFICSSGEPGYVTQLNLERAKNALRSTPEILAREFPGEA